MTDAEHRMILRSFSKEKIEELWQVFSDNGFASWLVVKPNMVANFHFELMESFRDDY
jgi:hypothetical protein